MSATVSTPSSGPSSLRGGTLDSFFPFAMSFYFFFILFFSFSRNSPTVRPRTKKDWTGDQIFSLFLRVENRLSRFRLSRN